MDGNDAPTFRRRSLCRDDTPDPAAGPSRDGAAGSAPEPGVAEGLIPEPDPAAGAAVDDLALDRLIHVLEEDLPQLQVRSGGIFALANAWAERHDAILARTPPALLPTARARLRRLGIRWGLASGSRVTREFPALPPQPRRRPKPRR